MLRQAKLVGVGVGFVGIVATFVAVGPFQLQGIAQAPCSGCRPVRLNTASPAGNYQVCFQGADPDAPGEREFTNDEIAAAGSAITVAWADPLRARNSGINIQIRQGSNNCQPGDIKVLRDPARNAVGRAGATVTSNSHDAVIRIPTVGYTIGGANPTLTEDQWKWMLAHEMGHVLDYDDAYQGLNQAPPECQDQTYMGDSWNWSATKCGDMAALNDRFGPPTGDPGGGGDPGEGDPNDPPDTPPDCSGFDECVIPAFSEDDCRVADPMEDTLFFDQLCQCCKSVTTPLLLSLRGPVALSDRAGGVLFDIRGGGTPVLVPWPLRNTEGWLVLDKNGSGSIDSGRELFGNYTIMTDGHRARDGFEALRELDTNGDMVFSVEDQSFSEVRLWFDGNRDGVSQPDELVTLQSIGLESINLAFRVSNRRDRSGNLLRLRAPANFADGSTKFIYDVYLAAKDGKGCGAR